jgi:hypothetical protein
MIFIHDRGGSDDGFSPQGRRDIRATLTDRRLLLRYHRNPKHGPGAYWGPKQETKKASNKLRRRIRKHAFQRDPSSSPRLPHGASECSGNNTIKNPEHIAQGH